MTTPPENVSMALFCDFENVALGVRDAKYEKFDIKPVLERLLLKGSIVVKKAYCDWDRYKGFKATMHEANFELIEIPHVRQSGKNSADIRLVVDALDLCYTKSHVNTFVIISGDSDFSPLVSKLRENAKQVIGVGVKQSTSDLLIANCDEFIFYDDLVREGQRAGAKRDAQPQAPAKRSPDEEKRRKDELEARRSKAIGIAVETFEALVSERGDSGKIWASMLKEAIKRRKPDFNESYYGFRAFGNLLEEAQSRGLLEFGRDEKSGAYVYRSNAQAPEAGVVVGGAGESARRDDRAAVSDAAEAVAAPASPVEAVPADSAPAADVNDARVGTGRPPRGGRKSAPRAAPADSPATSDTASATDEGADSAADAAARPEPGTGEQASAPPAAETSQDGTPAGEVAEAAVAKPARGKRGTGQAPRAPADGARDGRRRGAKAAPAAPVESVAVESAGVAASAPAPEENVQAAERKPAARSRRPRKAAAATGEEG